MIFKWMVFGEFFFDLFNGVYLLVKNYCFLIIGSNFFEIGVEMIKFVVLIGYWIKVVNLFEF